MYALEQLELIAEQHCYYKLDRNLNNDLSKFLISILCLGKIDKGVCMFFKKKKSVLKSNLPIKIENHIFGKLTKTADFWCTDEYYDFVLWGNKHTVSLWITDNNSITTKQEQAGKYFFDNIEKIQECVQNLLLNFFKPLDYKKLKNSIIVNSINITKSGNITASLTSELDDIYYNSVPESDDFTDDFGVVIFPEHFVIPNEYEFANFDL